MRLQSKLMRGEDQLRKDRLICRVNCGSYCALNIGSPSVRWVVGGTLQGQAISDNGCKNFSTCAGDFQTRARTEQLIGGEIVSRALMVELIAQMRHSAVFSNGGRLWSSSCVDDKLCVRARAESPHKTSEEYKEGEV